MRWKLACSGLAASWGFIAVLVSAADLGAEPLAFLRLALAAVTLAAVALFTRRSLHPGRALPGLVLLGLVQAAHWLLFFEAIKLGSVALAVLTFSTAPVLLAVVAPAFLPERVSRVGLAALPLGAVGVAIVALGGDRAGGLSAAALAAGLGSAATYAALVVIAKRLLLGEVPPLTVAFWDCLVGALALAPLLLLAGRVVPRGFGDWSAVIMLGVALTGFSTLAYAAVMRHVSAQAAGILTFLEPVAAVLLAALFLGQPVAPATVGGGALVLATGLAVVMLDPSASAAETATPPVAAESGP